ncbi:leucine-rich repeat and coiled-coil domain-containing protein 1 [Aplochiton taeniatus]
MADGELSLIDKNISSLLEVPFSSILTSLNLHCNRIPRIEGLTAAWYLRHLDLSSNRISRIEGLSSLSSLKTLNLSCNLITKVEGLNDLVNLTRLNLSHNQINDLTGLLYLHGVEYKLKHLSLHSNHLDSVNQLLQCLLGVKSLKNLTLMVDGKGNPLCNLPGYREMVFQLLPQVSILDGLDQLGHPPPLGEDSSIDIPGLEDYVEFLLSSDTSANELARGDYARITPRIDKVRTCLFEVLEPVGPSKEPHNSQRHWAAEGVTAGQPDNEQRIKTLAHQVSLLYKETPAGHVSSTSAPSVVAVRKARRDIDNTSESECDTGKESQRRSKIPTSHSGSITTVRRPAKARKSDSNQETAKQKAPMSALPQKKPLHAASGGVDTVGPARRSPIRAAKPSGDRSTKPSAEEETYRAIVEERDQERERRWKAEQAVRKMMEQMKTFQTRASKEKDLQSMALHTTDRLKEMLLKERAEQGVLQNRVGELEERCQSMGQQLEQARQREDQQQSALRSQEDSAAHGEATRARQQAEEMKRCQELENKAIALKREADIQKASARQFKDRLQQLHELLASREQVHRKELESRLTPGGPEFGVAVAKEVAAMEQRHTLREAELKERTVESRQLYAALEDEFRMALTIEASRLSEVREACEQLSAERSEVNASLCQSRQREKQSASLVQELTAMVKEQKSRISDLIKSKRNAVTELKARLRPLEAASEHDSRLNLQLELLKKDKSRLLSQLTAQESVIDDLRAERRIWGQELAQQGASLSQDRGRLEAKIEVLSNELETQRKHNDRDNDALRIKTKIINDQTETVRKLKEGLQERDEQIRRLHEEGVQAQRRFQEQLEEEMAPLAELRELVEQLSLRKEELKQHLEDKEVELDEVKSAHSASSKKWLEKADLLTHLESQVKRMKESFDSKESLLLEERDKVSQAHKAAMEKLHCMDDAFRLQLESVQASHQAELIQLANGKQKNIELANQRVYQVEEEMRQLLEETESTKKVMEEKIRRLTSVLKDF